jgi:hypothetical protein
MKGGEGKEGCRKGEEKEGGWRRERVKKMESGREEEGDWKVEESGGGRQKGVEISVMGTKGRW